VNRPRFVTECRWFKRNRRRDRRLAAAGIRVLRFVWEDLDDPAAIRRELTEVVRFRA